jgi:hypothetical protein
VFEHDAPLGAELTHPRLARNVTVLCIANPVTR